MPLATDEDLERWIASFRGPLIGLFASWGNDWRTAEELAADAFAEAWIGRGRLAADPADLVAVGSWLNGIAFHLSRSRQRRLAARRTEPIAGAHADELAAPIAEEDERRALLVQAFAQLSSAHQTVLRMHYLEGSSAREVAALLGLGQKAVEDRLYQARRALRERVDRGAAQSAAGARP
jgi:RNA polymerase sigma factor (sigma-70 family)